jgi:hypothetical protein
MLVPVLVFGGIAAFVIAIFVIAHWLAKKRREALAALAESQGLRFEADDRGQLLPYQQFKLFERGHSKRAMNFLVGEDAASGLLIVTADYRYVTGSGKHRQVHNQTICIAAHRRLLLPRCLLRRQRGFLDALGKFFGGTDFDFAEDPDFSRRYVLQGDDEAAVREAFYPELRKWSLEQDKRLQVECGGNAILVHHGRQLKVEAIPDLLRCTSSLLGLWLRPPWLRADEEDALEA